MKLYLKIIIIILALLIFTASYFYFQFKPSQDPQFGLSFSVLHAQYLGFDWKTLYLDMLNDLDPKRLRLMAYWETIEPEQGRFDFQITDEMLIEAGKRGIDVVLVVGLKQPRWPECHRPDWYEGLPADEKEKAQLNMVEQAVSHFRQFQAIKIWQIENEPFFEFGYNCPKTPAGMVKKEMQITRSLDKRPIMLTDSGEMGRWLPTANLEPDILGSTMYRVVYNEKLGYFKYPLPPAFFRIKAGILQKFSNVDKIFGAELQAEPWFRDGVAETELEAQYALMNPKLFKMNVEYAKRAGFEENYLWGVEWWYWLAHAKNDWGMWDSAKELMASDK